MMLKKIYLFLFLFISINTFLYAQQLNINYDTILLTADVPGQIAFPLEDNIYKATYQCDSSNYVTIITKNKISMRLSKPYEQYLPANNPSNPITCIVKINEGNGYNQRTHLFVLQPVSPEADTDPAAFSRDLRSIEKIQARINFLNSCQHVSSEKNNHVLSNNELINKPTDDTNHKLNGADTIYVGDLPVSRKSLTNAIRNRLSAFDADLNILGRKDASNWKEAVENAMKLFNEDENVIVTLSRGNNPPKQLNIRDYLVRLHNLPYSKTQVKMSKIQYISNIHKGKDNLYYGEITYLQTFTGIGENGEIKYQSIDNKTMQIKLMVTEEFKDGNYFSRITVYLGDISLTQQQ